jgi:hypothetical protein
MSIRIGSTPISAIRIGSTPVNEIRVGSTPVWSAASPMRDDFNRANTDPTDPNGLLPGSWVEHNLANDYFGAVVNNKCRLQLPDNIPALALQVSQKRWAAAQHPADDGYIECRIGSAGDPEEAFYTQVFRRLSNGAFTHGVGMQFDVSTIRIVRKVAGVDDIVEDEVGTFQQGDVIRQVDVGNVHTILRNGDEIGGWDDTGATASKGAGFRSMGMVVTAANPISWWIVVGPRKFSPALDYIECG